jgi:multiple sugar transport system substrate-binding protein
VQQLYNTPDSGLLSLPFAVYPTVTFYNKTLFDAIKLNYPPAHFGEKYRMPDGSLVNWNYDTLAQIARMRTLNAHGHNANAPQFDSTQTVQFGLNFQWQTVRTILTDIQPDPFYNSKSNRISIGQPWRTATQWLQNALWKDHIIPGGTFDTDKAFQPSAFAAGHVAMAIVPIWYTCCLANSLVQHHWNIGVVPWIPYRTTFRPLSIVRVLINSHDFMLH